MSIDIKKRRFLYATVFITGAAVIAIELTASRLMAPFFGNSIFVWGNIIGVTMAALAIGYTLGGRLADRRPDEHVLFMIVIIGGCMTSAIPVMFRVVVDLVVSMLSGFDLVLIAGSMISLLILFAFPLLLLGMAGPFVIRLLAEDVSTAGNTAGAVYAFSTLGSIIGTFVSTFITVPFLGSRETFFLFSFLLLVVGALGRMRANKLFLLLPLLPVLLWIFTAGLPIRDREGLVYETESPYQFIQVVDEPDGAMTLRTNDGRGIQSVYRTDTAYTGLYFDYNLVLPYFIDRQDIRVLNIGHAGGSISRLFTEEASKEHSVNFTGVEIDKKITETADTYFHISGRPITLVHDEGRNYLRQTDQLYDLMIIDAYSQQIYIPFHLVTQEFFSLARSRLVPGGILAINVNAVNEDSRLLQSVLSTLRSVFPFVSYAPIPGSYNYFVVASEHAFDYSQPLRTPRDSRIVELMQTLAGGVRQVSERRDAQVLTDNRAPVELMTDAMFFTLLKESRLNELVQNTSYGS